MPFGSVGPWEIILILLVLLLVFGARRLPELGGALGKGIREFKKSVRDIGAELNDTGDESAGELRSGARPGAQTAGDGADRQQTPVADSTEGHGK